jgi:hypothetical protein
MCETNRNGITESVFNVIKLYLSRLSACDVMYLLLGSSLNSDGQQINQYQQQNEQSPLSSTHRIQKGNKYMTLGQEQKCGGVKSINGIQQQCIYLCVFVRKYLDEIKHERLSNFSLGHKLNILFLF